MLTSKATNMLFVVNGIQYSRYYLLADGICTQWNFFVQTITSFRPLLRSDHEPSKEKKAHFGKRQEAYCKDVEQCFGIL
jgi:hypothetical protein